MIPILLVTGASGYLGGRLSAHLGAASTFQLRPGSRKDGLDLLSDSSLQAFCRDVDTVIHLASPNEIQSREAPNEALRINGIGTLKLLQAAAGSGVKRFIYFSTAHVYGSPLVGQIHEKSVPRPVHPYAITHRVAEDFVLSYHDQRKLQGLVFRLSNGFGVPTEPQIDCWTLLTNDLCKQAVTHRTLRLKSSGLQHRDFVTIHDVSRAVSHFLALENWGDGLFNIGGGKSLRILDVAVRIQARCQHVFGYTPEIKRPQALPGEAPAPFDYRIDKLLSTGFQLENNIDDEIDSTLTFCKSHFA